MNAERILIIFLFAEADDRRNQMRLYRRNLRDINNPFEVMTERDFKKTFRFTKELARMLIDQLLPRLSGIRTSIIPGYLKVLVTLHFLGHGTYQHDSGLSSVTAMSQSSVSRSIFCICRLITEILMPEWIQFPTRDDQKAIVKRGFFEKFGFRGVLGCIDGTHVEIIAPKVTDPDHPPFLYINRKGYHSINVMLICDSNCNIIACDARFPGSVHDSAIWRTSDIRNFLNNEYNIGDHRSHLIGDSGYPLEPWLFTPFARVQPATPEGDFNNLLTSTRNCVERTNGILKGRFRSILRHRVLHYSPENSAFIIYAAAVLHNIALWAKLDDDDLFVENEEDADNGAIVGDRNAEENEMLQRGRIARDEYIRLYIN